MSKSEYTFVEINENNSLVYDWYYNGNLKRFYGADYNDLKFKFIEFATKTIEDYKAGFPKEKLLSKIVAFIIRGYFLFHNDVYDNDNFIVGKCIFNVFDIEHFEYLNANIISKYTVDRDIDEIDNDNLKVFFEDMTRYYCYETVKDVSLLIKKAFVVAKSNGINCVEFDDSIVPKEYKGITAFAQTMKFKTMINYFLDQNEFDCLFEYSKKCFIDRDSTNNRFKICTDLILLSMTTGADPQNFIGLPYNSVDIQQKVIRLEDGRNLEIDQRGIEWLKETEFLHGEKFSESDKKFGLTKNGKYLSLSKYGVSLSKITKHLGLPIMVHDILKRSYIMFLILNGMSDKDIAQKIAGFDENTSMKLRELYYDFKKNEIQKKE